MFKGRVFQIRLVARVVFSIGAIFLWSRASLYSGEENLLVKAASRNIIQNPGFESDEDNKGKPDGWIMGSDWALDTNVSHTGDNSARIHIPAGQEKKSNKIRMSNIELKPDTAYVFSAWVKLENVSKHFGLYMMQSDKEGKSSGKQLGLNYGCNSGTRDWVQVHKIFRSYNKTSKCFVYSNIYGGSGTAWVDDIRLYPIKYEDEPSYVLTGKYSFLKGNTPDGVDVKNVLTFGKDYYCGIIWQKPGSFDITVNLKKKFLIDKIALFYMANNSSYKLPKGAVYGSMDNSKWELIGAIDYDSGPYPSSGDLGKSEISSIDKVYQYIRLSFESFNWSGVWFKQVQIFGGSDIGDLI